MKRLTILFLFFSSLISAEGYTPHFPDYYDALSRYGKHQYFFCNYFTTLCGGTAMEFRWRHEFQNNAIRLYTRNQGAPEKADVASHIPKIIHQIWMGPPMPELYKIWMKSWTGLNGWEYRLWTDQEADAFEFTHPELWKNAKNYGERANILRYEVLHRYGGLYVDVDMQCIDPAFFEYAHSHYDFYVGLEPLDHGFMTCNAVVGAIPNHPLLTKMIKDMPQYYEGIVKDKNYKKVNFFGPTYISRKLLEYGVRTETTDMVFPGTYFYPISIKEVVQKSWDAAALTFPETAAIHWWDGSWLKKEAQLSLEGL